MPKGPEAKKTTRNQRTRGPAARACALALLAAWACGVPAEAGTVVGMRHAPCTTYTVAAGETLSSIAWAFLGHPRCERDVARYLGLDRSATPPPGTRMTARPIELDVVVGADDTWASLALQHRGARGPDAGPWLAAANGADAGHPPQPGALIRVPPYLPAAPAAAAGPFPAQSVLVPRTQSSTRAVVASMLPPFWANRYLPGVLGAAVLDASQRADVGLEIRRSQLRKMWLRASMRPGFADRPSPWPDLHALLLDARRRVAAPPAPAAAPANQFAPAAPGVAPAMPASVRAVPVQVVVATDPAPRRARPRAPHRWFRRRSAARAKTASLRPRADPPAGLRVGPVVTRPVDSVPAAIPVAPVIVPPAAPVAVPDPPAAAPVLPAAPALPAAAQPSPTPVPPIPVPAPTALKASPDTPRGRIIETVDSGALAIDGARPQGVDADGIWQAGARPSASSVEVLRGPAGAGTGPGAGTGGAAASQSPPSARVIEVSPSRGASDWKVQVLVGEAGAGTPPAQPTNR
jgi:hypothetical protein